MPPVLIPRPSTERPLQGYLSVPAVGGAPWPGVVVLHEGFGLSDDIHQHAEHLGAAGYLTVAPDLYSRGSRWRCMLAAFRSLARAEGPAFEDIELARRWLAERADCTGRVAVLGFCMGGGFALIAATRGFDASAPNYPGLLRERTPAQLRGACPIVASYATRDPFARQGAAARLDAALSAVGVEHDVREYAGARHSFLSRHDVGPFGVFVRIAGFGYDAAAAEEAWARILRFFAAHLQDPSPPVDTSGQGAR